MAADPEAPEPPPWGKDTAGAANRLVNLINRFKKTQFEEGYPAADPHVYSIALRFAPGVVFGVIMVAPIARLQEILAAIQDHVLGLLAAMIYVRGRNA